MKKIKNRIIGILIAALLIFSIGASTVLVQNASAHSPPNYIPTYAYIVAEPNPIGVSQTLVVYMWLDPVYGDAILGAGTPAVGTDGRTASGALLSNNYRFSNYQLTITGPDGKNTTQTFPTISDPTSNQAYQFTPSEVGTYTLSFNYPGQVYGANGDGYSGSLLVNDTYLASNATTTVTVQSTPIPAAIGSSPLPSAYWESPVYGENTIWYSITSDWLGSGSPVPAGYSSSTLFHGDAVGPLTSHIMWTNQLQFGGVSGGNTFYNGGGDPNNPQGVQYWEGSSYQPRFTNPIVIDGYLYYTEPVSFSGGDNGPTVCLNLKNGQILWSSTNVPPLSFGYVYNLWDPDQHGVFPPILFTANFAQAFDGFTGQSLFNVTGVPTGNAAMGPSGEQLRYVITNTGTTSNPAWYLSEWNSSKLWQYDINPYTGSGSLSPALVNASNGMLIGGAVILGSGVGGGPPIPIIGTSGTLPNGTTGIIPGGSSILVNASIPINSPNWAPGTNIPIRNINFDSLTTYDWNISIPWRNTMALTPSVIAVNPGDIMLLRNGTLPSGFAATGTGTSQGPYTFFAVDLNTTHSTFGQVLWSQTYNPPAGNLTVVQGPVDFQTRVFIVSTQENMQWFGYSLTTGALLWGPTASQASFDYYGNPGTTTLPGSIAYGTLYCSSFSGILYAYNDLTGKIIFTYGNGGEGNSTQAGLNVFYGDYPTMIQSIANGVVYLATNEHTVPDPIYKGATTEAVNATTGEQMWQLSDYPSEWGTPGSAYVVADGYATFMNGYDNQIYSVGQGPSSTTIQAPQTAIAAGTNVVIQGTVMDVSAGTTQSQQKADFPNGVPAASDASMTTWMGYVYQQQPLPTNFTGVEVSIDAKDPNGNIIHIGDTNTTQTGLYTYTWTAPNIPGDYLVTATFAGNNGYWGSSAQTGMNVQAAHAIEPTPTPTTSNLATTTDLMTYIIASAIAIIIVIVIVGLLILRKHP